MSCPTMNAESFGYREALAQVSAELTRSLHDERERRRRQRREPERSLLLDSRGLALSVSAQGRRTRRP